MGTFAFYINTFSFIPTLIVALYTLLVYKTLYGPLKTFAWFIFLSGVIEFTSRILWFNSKNNMPLLHLYVAGGFIALTFFYRDILKDVIDKKITRILLFLFLSFTIINSLFIQSIFTFNSYALTVEAVIIVIFSLSTFIIMVNDLMKKNHIGLVNSINWINSGIFIYYSSSLLIFHFGHLITLFAPSSLVNYTWVLHSFFSVVMYCCFFVALWNRPRK